MMSWRVNQKTVTVPELVLDYFLEGEAEDGGDPGPELVFSVLDVLLEGEAKDGGDLVPEFVLDDVLKDEAENGGDLEP